MTATELMALFSKRLSALLEENHMTQSDLATILGVSDSTVGKWILKKALPRMGIIEKLSQHFGVPKSYFVEEGSKNVKSYYLNSETAEMAQLLHDNPQYKVMFDSTKDMRPEDVQKVIDFIRWQRHQEGYDDD